MTLKFRHSLLAAAAVSVSLMCSCNEEDPFSLPYDMATQNMMDEDHGRTLLATTDVYIDRNHNFTTADNFICDYGQVLDLGHVEEADPDITTLTNQAAVQPDEGYLLMSRESVHRFPSGCVGIAINSTYRRMWVDSWRWDGVPFFVRAGKSLAKTVTEVMIEFKNPPQVVFNEPAGWFGGTNRLRSKLPPVVQSQVRRFRGELIKASAK